MTSGCAPTRGMTTFSATADTRPFRHAISALHAASLVHGRKQKHRRQSLAQSHTKPGNA